VHPALVLVHSPLVGPLTWKPVARELEARWSRRGRSFARRCGGHGPALSPEDRSSGGRGDQRSQRLLRNPGGPQWRRSVAADHGGCLGGSTVGAIYVDALLPYPGVSWFDRAPDELAEQMRHIAEDGVLPPWHEWFDAEVVDGLLPDPELRGRFVAELPRLPVAAFEETTPEASWSGPSAYVLLSGTYGEEAGRARTRGWPVVEQRAHHLAMLTDPSPIAEGLRRSLALMGFADKRA
jgi:hypothetical protein